MEYTQQGRRYAEYYRPRWPWRRLAWWWQRRRQLQRNPPPPKSDGLDYTGWTARIFEKDPDDVFPRAEHVGSVGFVAESWTCQTRTGHCWIRRAGLGATSTAMPPAPTNP